MDAEGNYKVATLLKLTEQQKTQLAELTADFDRRTDILNNHIAREKVLEERVKTLEDALTDEISEIAALAGPCQFGRIERCVCFKCRRERSRQALVAKEPPEESDWVLDHDGCKLARGAAKEPKA